MVLSNRRKVVPRLLAARCRPGCPHDCHQKFSITMKPFAQAVHEQAESSNCTCQRGGCLTCMRRHRTPLRTESANDLSQVAEFVDWMRAPGDWRPGPNTSPKPQNAPCLRFDHPGSASIAEETIQCCERRLCILFGKNQIRVSHGCLQRLWT